MAVIRTIKKENPFVQLDRHFLEKDDNLTWKAKGMLAYLLSRPDDWKTNHKDLVKRAKESKNTVTTILKELEKAGYVHYYQERLEGGKFGNWKYDVYERPEFNPSYQCLPPYPKNEDTVKKPRPENRDTDKRDTDKRDTDNWDYNDIELKDIDFTDNDLSNIDDDEKEPFEINFYAFQEFKKDFEDNFPNTFDERFYSRIIEIMTVKKMDFITYPEAVEQLKYMADQREKGLQVGDSAKYFVGGIELRRTSRYTAMDKAKLRKAENELKARKEKQELEREANQESRVPFYNWLEQ